MIIKVGWPLDKVIAAIKRLNVYFLAHLVPETENFALYRPSKRAIPYNTFIFIRQIK